MKFIESLKFRLWTYLTNLAIEFLGKLQCVFDLLVWRTQSSIAPCVIDSNEIFLEQCRKPSEMKN